MAGLYVTLPELVAMVQSGGRVCLAKHTPFALLREIVRSGVKDLELVAAPTGNFGVDFLVAAGVVTSVEAGAVHLGEYGLAPNFTRAWERGEVTFIESSCPVIENALYAGSAGLPFVAVPGLLGSDILRDRPDFLVIRDPFDTTRDVVVVPAIVPDVSLIHGRRADRFGNVICGIQNDERLVCSAAKTVLATVETVVDEPEFTLAADEQVIPSIYFDGIAVVPNGAHPFGANGVDGHDEVAIQRYIAASRTSESMADYLEYVVFSASDESEYRRRSIEEEVGV